MAADAGLGDEAGWVDVAGNAHSVFAAAVTERGFGPDGRGRFGEFDFHVALRAGGAQSVDLALQHDATVVDDDDCAAHLGNQVQLVAAQQQGNSVGDLLAQDVAEHLGGDGVKPGEWLVEYQQVGFVEKGECQLHSLLVAAGKALHGVGSAVGEAEPLEPGVGGAGRCGGGEAGKSGVVDKVVAHLHPLVHTALGGHVAEALAGDGVDRVALPADRPVVDGEQPHDGSHGGGLAGAIRAEEADDLAALNCEADPVERQQRAEPFGDLVDRKHPRRTYPEEPVTQRRADRFAPACRPSCLPACLPRA